MMQDFPERYLAIDNVCAWPNLTQLGDGTLIATNFNRPSHGRMQGEVECWESTDDGRNWRYRSTPARHEPNTNRMNVAAGLAQNGDMLVLVSGWKQPAPGQEETHEYFKRNDLLSPWLCRSVDRGKTWDVDKTALPSVGPEWMPFIPFGDVTTGADGVLGATGYCSSIAQDNEYSLRRACFFLSSRDDGRSWEKPIAITPETGYSEGALLYLGDGRWITAVRSQGSGHLDLFRSDDNGQSWRFDHVLTMPRQHPAHLLCLRDGRILLTYGVRCRDFYGVHARLSDDDGASWNAPFGLTTFIDGDGGYPSSVQNADGSIATAYYASGQPLHQRYHMGVVKWRVAD